MNIHNLTRRVASAAAIAVMGGTMLLTAPLSFADDDHHECREKVERAESRLNNAIERHGPNSHEAYDRRRELNAQRERCWERYHGWWSARDQRWHSDRDWDRDEHDRDHDRDNH